MMALDVISTIRKRVGTRLARTPGLRLCGYVLPAVFGLLAVVGTTAGCNPALWGVCAEIGATETVRGQLLEQGTEEPISSFVRLEAWASTDEEFTGSGRAREGDVKDDGIFEVRMSTGIVASICRAGPFVHTVGDTSPEFPVPDQIVVIVEREQGCVPQFTIDINEDTVVDIDFPDDVVELKDPILVGPCEE